MYYNQLFLPLLASALVDVDKDHAAMFKNCGKYSQQNVRSLYGIYSSKMILFLFQFKDGSSWTHIGRIANAPYAGQMAIPWSVYIDIKCNLKTHCNQDLTKTSE